MSSKTNKIYTVLIGGAAGDGVKEAGISLGKWLVRSGFHVFISNEYPSLIRGGHNFCRVTFGVEKIWNDHSELDIILALNAETIKLHTTELNKSGVIIFDDSIADKVSGVGLSMKQWLQEFNAPSITRTAVALGALGKTLGLKMEILENIFEETFGKKGKAEVNIKLARRGYSAIKDTKYKIHNCRFAAGNTKYSCHTQLIDGNQAFSDGLLAAGLQTYFAYPMTPASSILHYLAHRAGNHPVKVIQPENEIAAVSMAVGAASVGSRSAVGTSGGGFALMEETVSLAGITETPVVIAISQRPGPATGVPTGTAQADLAMARNAGHGEFPRIVLAPGDAAESFELGGAALNLAWQFQTPVLFLLDKHVSESLVSTDFSKIKIKINHGKLAGKAGTDYGRYKITKDGVSPLVFAGAAGARVKINSYEHDEHGLATEDLKMIVAMADKRSRKTVGIERELLKYQPVKVYGNKKASAVILFWGSTKGAVLEALKYIKKPVKAVQVLAMEPFPVDQLKRELKNAKKIIAIEANATGQLAQLAREKCGVKISRTVLRYDGRPFVVEELVSVIG